MQLFNLGRHFKHYHGGHDWHLAEPTFMNNHGLLIRGLPSGKQTLAIENGHL